MEEDDDEENGVEAVENNDTEVGFLEEEWSASELVTQAMNEGCEGFGGEHAEVVVMLAEPATDVNSRSSSKCSQSAR